MTEQPTTAAGDECIACDGPRATHCESCGACHPLAEARQPDSSPLRVALERLVTEHLILRDGYGRPAECRLCGAGLASGMLPVHRDWCGFPMAEAALAALPPSAPPVLDARLLAEAINLVAVNVDGNEGIAVTSGDSVAIAAEYARLAQDRSPEPSE